MPWDTLAWSFTWSQGVQHPLLSPQPQSQSFHPGRGVTLVRCDLPLVYPFCLVSVTFLSFLYLEMVSRICSVTFLGRGQGSWLIARVTVLRYGTYGWSLDLTYYQDHHMDACSCVSVQPEPKEFVLLNCFWPLVLVCPTNGFVHWSCVWTPGQD